MSDRCHTEMKAPFSNHPLKLLYSSGPFGTKYTRLTGSYRHRSENCQSEPVGMKEFTHSLTRINIFGFARFEVVRR
jgi:hypothetical protein